VKPPVSGKKTTNVETLDAVMVKYLERTGSTAATLAVSIKGTLLHSRGYGWVDKEKTVPCQPNTLIGIASCDKPIIAALIRLLAQRGAIRLEEGFFKAYQFNARGKVIDQRVHKITIQHVLDHKAGWSPADADSWLGDWLKGASPESILERAMTCRLAHDPGEKFAYCNIGYDLLRALAERKFKKPWDECCRTDLFKPASNLGICATSAVAGRKQMRGIPVVWNAKEGGPTCASAPFLCQFMHRYWLTGAPRDKGNPLWAMYGSLPGSTALMIWRSDGIDVVAVFNGRDKATHAEIAEELEKALKNDLVRLPKAGVDYYLQSLVSGLFLNVKDENKANGGAVCQAALHHAQTWRLIPSKEHAGYYYIQSQLSSLYLDVTGGKKGVGDRVGQAAQHRDQVWRLVPAEEAGYFYVQTQISGLNLDVKNGSQRSGDPICQATPDARQVWRFIPAK
jgi:hypothetical protein